MEWQSTQDWTGLPRGFGPSLVLERGTLRRYSPLMRETGLSFVESLSLTQKRIKMG